MQRQSTWISKAIKKPGRVKTYLKRRYGEDAFLPDGNIRMQYLNIAIKDLQERGDNPSLLKAIVFARTLKRM